MEEFTTESLTASLKKFQIVNASTLKIIAMVAMLVDHVAGGILLYNIREGFYPFGLDFGGASNLYYALRHVGRTAFPIYCFLLVEGLKYTRSVPKYLMNLGIFGVLAEFPFDIALKVQNVPFTSDILFLIEENRERILGNSNTFFTLIAGLLAIWCMKFVEEKLFTENRFSPIGVYASNPFYMVLYLAPLGAAAWLAYVINTDYDAWGVALIGILFMFRRSRVLACVLGYLFFMNMESEVWAFPAFILMLLYNGERGCFKGNSKYLFYAFYPVHLMIIFLVRVYM